VLGTLRLVIGIARVVGATLVVALLQPLILRTGIVGAHVVPDWWHRRVVRALGLRIHVRGALSPKRPLLVASNHISWADIMVLGSLGSMTFIAKSDMARWPVIGWLVTLQRTVFVDRDDTRKSAEQAGEIGRRLAGGEAMVLFAEGTTGDGNFLLPFKSSLFGAADVALKQGAEVVHVQPVSIAYTGYRGLPMGRRYRPMVSWIGDADLIPHLARLFRDGPVDVVVGFGEPVAYSSASRRKEVARGTRDAVRAMMIDALHGD
jgi:1-acyl-sn-glycerol-3-phosphate acyltransferase